jgi:hypothetical protein
LFDAFLSNRFLSFLPTFRNKWLKTD